MIDLDTRARSAADGLRAAVAAADLATTPPGSAGPHRPWVAFAAGVAAAAAVVVALVVDFPQIEEPVTASTMASTTTSVVEQPTTTVVAPDPAPTAPPAPVPVPESTTTTVDTTPPPLTITDPADGSETDQERMTFRGTTEPGARVYAGPYEATVDSDGTWSIVLLLSPGDTTARFTAVDAAGNETSAAVTVTLSTPEPETTTTTSKPKPDPETTSTTKPAEEAVAAFTATATLGASAESPPYDVYYGTGEPGTLIQVSSPYGSGSTEVRSDGSWDVKVFFPDAPIGKSFDVTVKDDLGRKKSFGFTHTEA